MSKTKVTAFELGKRAFYAGVAITSNPFTSIEYHAQWVEGWKIGETQALDSWAYTNWAAA